MQGGFAETSVVMSASLTYFGWQGGKPRTKERVSKMASITTNTTGFGTTTTKRGIGARIFDAMVRMAEAHPKYKEAQYLASLSDEQLAKLGMTRADIPARVYGSRFL